MKKILKELWEDPILRKVAVLIILIFGAMWLSLVGIIIIAAILKVPL